MNIHPLWYICLLTRISFMLLLIITLTYLNKIQWIHAFFVCILIILGSGFLYKYLTGSNDEIQIAKVFWHESRLIHGVLYLVAAYYFLIKNIKMVAITLLVDLITSFLYRMISNK